jgi:hypothetical protein
MLTKKNIKREVYIIMIMGKRPMDEKKVQKMKMDGYDGFY